MRRPCATCHKDVVNAWRAPIDPACCVAKNNHRVRVGIKPRVMGCVRVQQGNVCVRLGGEAKPVTSIFAIMEPLGRALISAHALPIGALDFLVVVVVVVCLRGHHHTVFQYDEALHVSLSLSLSLSLSASTTLTC